MNLPLIVSIVHQNLHEIRIHDNLHKKNRDIFPWTKRKVFLEKVEPFDFLIFEKPFRALLSNRHSTTWFDVIRIATPTVFGMSQGYFLKSLSHFRKTSGPPPLSIGVLELNLPCKGASSAGCQIYAQIISSIWKSTTILLS